MLVVSYVLNNCLTKISLILVKLDRVSYSPKVFRVLQMGCLSLALHTTNLCYSSKFSTVMSMMLLNTSSVPMEKMTSL